MFKVINESEHHLTLAHPDGHHVAIAKRALSKKTLEQFKNLPRVNSFADGGEVPDPTAGLEPDPAMDRTPASPDSSSPTQFDPLAPFKNIASSYLNNPVLQGAKNAVTGLGNAVKNEFQAPNPNYKPPEGLQKASLNTEGPPRLMNINVPQGSQQGGGTDLGKLMESTANAQLGAVQGPVRKIQQAEMDQAKAIEDQNKANAKLYDQQTALEQAAYEQHQKERQSLDQEQAAVSREIHENKLDPMRVWNTKGTGGKVSTAIGIILGGIGAGLTGGENQALSFLHKQMSDDLEAQKGDLGNKKTLLEANFRRYGNLQDAERATQLHQAFVIKAQLDKNAAMSNSESAKANAIKAGQEWEVKTIAPLKAQLAQSQMRSKLLAGGVGGPNSDQKSAFMVNLVVPKELQDNAHKELTGLQNAKSVGETALKAWDDISKMALAGTFSPNDKHSAKEAIIAQLSKDTAGRYTPQDADAISNLFPSPLDSDATRKKKRQRLFSFVSEKMHSSLLDSYGIPKPGLKAAAPINAPEGYTKASMR